MDSETALKKLENAGIVREEFGEVNLSETFEQRLERTLSGADGTRYETIEAIREVLNEHYRDFEFPYIELLLDNLFNGFPPAEGVPANFFPSQPDQLRAVIEHISFGLVYVWEADNQHCTIMQEQLEELTNQKDTGSILLLAVCGQMQSEILQHDLDVHAIPTTLFIRNGAIDTRLQFCPPMTVLVAEWDNSFLAN